MDEPQTAPQSPVRSVERALQILSALERSGGPMRLVDLARTTGIHKSTAQRLLTVLERNDLVQREQTHYQIGLGAVPLAHAFFVGNSLSRSALPVLQELAGVTKFTASLFMRHGFDRIVVQRAEGLHGLRYSMPIGQRIPLYLGAGGYVLAAAMPEKDLQALVRQVGDAQLASGQIQTGDQLLAKVRQAAQQGFSIAQNERSAGIISVAAPVIVPGKPVIAAVAIIAPLDKVPQDTVQQLQIEVTNAARAIGERHISL